MFKYHTKKMEKYYDQVVNMYLAGCSISTILQKNKVVGRHYSQMDSDMGGRHHIHTDMDKRRGVQILLSLNDFGCLHGGGMRLERGSHPIDQTPH